MLLPSSSDVEPIAALNSFRADVYDALTARADELFELTDALVCCPDPVRVLPELSLEPEHRRRHGALYAGLNHGRLDVDQLRWALADRPLPRIGGRLVLAVDTSPWLRPAANTSPERAFCHTYGRVHGHHEMIPGWPYSVVAALEEGRSSWVALLDAVRVHPGDDETVLTATQLRDVLGRLELAGQWQPGDPNVLVVCDAGYDLPRLAWLLADLPVTVIGRVRSNRVYHLPASAPRRTGGRTGRPPIHGPVLKLAVAATWPTPDVTTMNDTSRYGTARVIAWRHLHPRLTHTGGWKTHPGRLPILEGTLIRLPVDHLPGDRHPAPVWLWTSDPDTTPTDVDRAWQAFLRRFDLEHTFRFLKQTLGWTRPKLRDPCAADTWTWLILTAHTQLRLARTLTDDLRRPWERVPRPGRLTPARVRRGFRRLHPTLVRPTELPKLTVPGPGRPPGIPNQTRTPRYDVEKPHTPTKRRQRTKVRR